jgi:hypothetical protein
MDICGISSGERIAIGEVATRLGGDIHKWTPKRWATVGVSGVVLESVYIGGRMFTDKEMLGRFFEAVAKAKRGPRNIAAPVASAPRATRRHTAAVDAELDKLGV